MKSGTLRSLIVLSAFLMLLSGCKAKIGEGDKAWNSMVDADRHDLSLDGYSLHYIDKGIGDPVIMVHGFADSTYCWHENVETFLGAGYRVILVDQPGLGRSGIPPEPYVFSVENQAGEVLKLADHLKLEQFSLIGSSLGGAISLYLAMNHPDRVGKVIVLDPVCYRPSGPPHLLGLPGVKSVASALSGRWTIRLALRDVYFNKEKVDDILIDEYSRPLNKPGYIGVLASLMREGFSPEYERMTENYKEMEPDVLIVWGDHDKWLSPEFGTRLHADLPNSRHEVIANCGHLPHQELPDIVNPLLVDFVQANESNPD